MSVRASSCLLVAFILLAGCRRESQEPAPVKPSQPPPAPVTVISPPAPAVAIPPIAPPGFDSPEALTRLLEQRWSLADIQKFCIPERRHNVLYQNLVTDSPKVWKGRLYPDKLTGFDTISWYANVSDGKAHEYSLGVNRGNDFWLLEIGSPETVRKPPQVTPDPSAPYFVGHK